MKHPDRIPNINLRAHSRCLAAASLSYCCALMPPPRLRAENMFGISIARVRASLALLLVLTALPAGNCFAMLDIRIQSSNPNGNYYAANNDTGDAQPGFQQAISALVDAGGGRLYIPGGTYRFNGNVSYKGTAQPKISIIGASRIGVKLKSYNSDGVFRFEFLDALQTRRITLKAVTFLAGRPDAGTAFKMTIQRGSFVNKHVLMVHNVDIVGNDSTTYFNNGIVANDLYLPVFSSCTFRGKPSTTDWSNSSPKFAAACGIDASGCYDPVFWNCSATNAQTGFYLSSNRVPESGAWYACTTNSVKTGISNNLTLDTGSGEPGLWIRNCDITARDEGIHVRKRHQLFIADNTFRQGSTAYSICSLKLIWCHAATVLANTFVNNTACTDISVDKVDTEKIGVDQILARNNLSGNISVHPGAINIYQYENY